MGSSSRAGGRLLGFLSDVATRGAGAALRTLNLDVLAGQPIEDIFLGLVDYVCPDGGSIDQGIAREAFVETIADLAGSGVTDLDSLTAEQVQTVFELYATNAIEARLCNDIGRRAITLPSDASGATQVDAFEAMRDLAAEGYRTETGDTWRPRNGSHSSQTGKLTSAAIDARDYLRARKDRETNAHLPEGTLVAFTGGKDFDDVTAIWRSLDSIKIKYDDMVLLHGGGPGAEKIAASWAEKNGVHQVVCKPNWGRDGKAAPFRRNDVLLNFLPKGLVAFPGSGITNNMIDKARKIGIPVLLAAA